MTLVRLQNWLSAAVCLLLVGLLLLEVRRNWQGGELATHEDEAGHFVTGMMVYDYLTAHLGEEPLAFAEGYYVRYPKVALGHWPPLYYVFQSAWYALWGAGIQQAHLLNYLFGAAFVFAWWAGLRKHFSWPLLFGSAAFLLSMPVLHRSVVLVLSDMPVVLSFWLVALLWLRSFTAAGFWPYLALSLCSAAAILLKGNSWVLLFPLAAAPLLSREFEILRRPALWMSICGIVLLGAPFYLYVRTVGAAYPLDTFTNTSQWVYIVLRVRRLWSFWSLLPSPAWGLVLMGCYAGWKLDAGPLRRLWAFGVSVSLGMVAFMLLSGLSFEERVFAPLLPFLMLICLVAIRHLGLRWSWVPAVFLLMLLVARPANRVDAVKGFREVAAELPFHKEGVPILVASDSVGEGALVAQRLIADPYRSGFVLRASRLFSQQFWRGAEYRELFQNDEDALRVIDEIPVHYVVLDDASRQPHVQRLRRLASRWRLLERRRTAKRTIEVYELSQNLGQPVQQIRFSLGLDRNGRVVEYRRPKP